jgi:bifunctional UDP-N-acetylglucosamine pyrophosphorylase/glucosamine-1-phosphate N-acetyltransferase
LSAASLKQWLPHLDTSNAQKEYYLTDIVAKAASQGLLIYTVSPSHEYEIFGVNDGIQLNILERYWQRNRALELMAAGVTVMDAARLDIRGTVQIEADVVLDVNVILEGCVILKKGVRIGANTLIKNSVIESHSVIHAHSIVDGANIASHCQVGPFARVRPGTELLEGARIGNFVEIKQSRVGSKTKINHLSYIGDALIGEKVNIGAGTITCNYNGLKKQQTIIEDGAFIGSDCQLIAPLRIGAGATIGAGTTLSKDAPAGQLTLSRVSQKTVANWLSPAKQTDDQDKI